MSIKLQMFFKEDKNKRKNMSRGKIVVNKCTCMKNV